MTNASLQKIIERYVAGAIGYQQSIEDGSVRASDMYCEQIEEAFSELKTYGSAGLRAIASLLATEEESVRLWASSHLLNYPEFESLRVLEDLTKSPSVLALTAEVTLDRWKKGEMS